MMIRDVYFDFDFVFMFRISHTSWLDAPSVDCHIFFLETGYWVIIRAASPFGNFSFQVCSHTT